MLMHASLPTESFNAAVRDGTADRKIGRILDDLKPEAVYFTERDGVRGVYLIVEVENAARIPALAEPWFLTFNSSVELRIVMSPEELQKAGLDKIGKKYRK
jgi:hypothetical protein